VILLGIVNHLFGRRGSGTELLGLVNRNAFLSPGVRFTALDFRVAEHL
jgi:hypothetical protein